MAEVGNLLEKIVDPMTFIIRVVELMDGYFLFLWEFLGFLYFFKRIDGVKILGNCMIKFRNK